MIFGGIDKKKVGKYLVPSIMLFFCFTGVVLASSGHEAAPAGWTATDWYRVMNFAVLAGILFFVLRKPLSNALNGRIKGIEDQLDDLERKKSDAEKKLAEYNEKIATLDKEAETIIAEYNRQGEEARKRILEESKKAAIKLEDQAKKNIENEFSKAKAKLMEDILSKALIKAEDLVQKKITPEDQDRLVDEYLDKVVA